MDAPTPSTQPGRERKQTVLGSAALLLTMTLCIAAGCGAGGTGGGGADAVSLGTPVVGGEPSDTDASDSTDDASVSDDAGDDASDAEPDDGESDDQDTEGDNSEVPDDGANDSPGEFDDFDTCAAIEGRSFFAPGISLSFVDGTFIWTDIAVQEVGVVSCDGLDVTGSTDAGSVFTGGYAPHEDTILWEGAVYRPRSQGSP